MAVGNGLLEPDRYATGIIIVFYADEAAQCSFSLSFSLFLSALDDPWPSRSFLFWRASIIAYNKRERLVKNQTLVGCLVTVLTLSRIRFGIATSLCTPLYSHVPCVCVCVDSSHLNLANGKWCSFRSSGPPSPNLAKIHQEFILAARFSGLSTGSSCGQSSGYFRGR